MEDLCLIPGLGRSSGEGNGNPLQYSCLENLMAGEPGGLQSMGSQRVGHHWATNTIKSYRHMYELHKTLGFLKFLLRSLHNRIWIMRFLKNNLKKTILSLGCWYSCNPMNCNLPGSSIHGILHARILEWVDISFSRGSSCPRNWTQVSRIAGWCFTDWATRKLPF